MLKRSILIKITLLKENCLSEKCKSWSALGKLKFLALIVLPCFRAVRKEYITAKYVDHRFSRKTCSSSSAKLSALLEAIRSRDLLALVQVYTEGVELMEPLLEPGQVRLHENHRQGMWEALSQGGSFCCNGVPVHRATLSKSGQFGSGRGCC